MIHLGIPTSGNQWIVLLLGLVSAVGSAIPLAQGVSSLSWSEADGVIVYCRDKPGRRTRGVDVEYRYTTAGRTYSGNRYRFQSWLGRNTMRSRDVQAIVGRYPAGEPVRVAVNPRDPADSVLVRGVDFDSLIPLGLGLVLILMGIGQVKKDPRAEWTQAFPADGAPRYRLAIGLAMMGVGLVLLGATYVYRAMNSLQWPSVPGRIFYSHARGGRQTETLLWYEYHVDNQRYVASDIRTGGNVAPLRKIAEETAKRYPAGSAVSVYYNPGDPSQALLEPGVWYGVFIAPAIGVLLLGAAWLAKKYAQAVAFSRRRS